MTFRIVDRHSLAEEEDVLIQELIHSGMLRMPLGNPSTEGDHFAVYLEKRGRSRAHLTTSVKAREAAARLDVYIREKQLEFSRTQGAVEVKTLLGLL